MKQAMKQMNYQSNDFDILINRISLLLGILNLQENLTQSDKQDIVDNFNEKAEELMSKINAHLQLQDQKIDRILEILGEGD